CMQVVQTPHSF
nr:immunoglobulin light chain junction region [Macaca mulatta]MPN90620.1 immunoglobulin light chain junction region [Macaca mulatta]